MKGFESTMPLKFSEIEKQDPKMWKIIANGSTLDG